MKTIIEILYMKIKGVDNQDKTMIDADVIDSTQRGTFGEKVPLGRTLCNFWLCMCTPKGSSDLWSLPVAMVLVLLYYILYYCSSKKKTRGETGHAQNILPVTSGQSLFQSRDFRSRHFQ